MKVELKPVRGFCGIFGIGLLLLAGQVVAETSQE